jgi:HTH-type transcriptional regulator/antitoxin MqsA
MALDELSRKRNANIVRTVREELKITQQQATAIFGGGHNAFYRYEKGQEAVPQPLLILMQLLQKHPELFYQIKLQRV